MTIPAVLPFIRTLGSAVGTLTIPVLPDLSFCGGDEGNKCPVRTLFRQIQNGGAAISTLYATHTKQGQSNKTPLQGGGGQQSPHSMQETTHTKQGSLTKHLQKPPSLSLSAHQLEHHSFNCLLPCEAPLQRVPH